MHYSVALVRERTIPTEQPPPVGEVSANFLRIEGCHVVSATVPRGRFNLCSLDRSRYFFIQVAPQLTSRGWVDPIPDPLLLRKSGSAGNRTRDLCICNQKLWPLDHRGGRYMHYTKDKYQCSVWRKQSKISLVQQFWLNNSVRKLVKLFWILYEYIPRHDAAWKFPADYIRVRSGLVVIPLHCISYLNLTDSRTQLSCHALIPFVPCIKNIKSVLHLPLFTT